MRFVVKTWYTAVMQFTSVTYYAVDKEDKQVWPLPPNASILRILW